MACFYLIHKYMKKHTVLLQLIAITIATIGLVYMGAKMESLDNAVVEMYLENHEISDIADSTNTTVLEVIRILRENGFEVKR